MSVGDVSAILLAAGLSQRMGAVNKLQIPVDGVPLLRRSAKRLTTAGLGEVVVVLGHDSEQTSALIDDLPVRTVLNTDYKSGQMSSVHRGLEALSRPCAGVMVCLSDQPLLDTDDIVLIARAFIADCPRPLLVPTWQGERGNPIVMSWEQREAILRGGRNLGCRRLIQNNPELVWTLPMPNDHCVADMDSPEDYRRLRAQWRTPPNRTQPTTATTDLRQVH
jgi:molybdenum cofactor cytidylyltransferase